MTQRTASKTRRTAAMQFHGVRPRAFTDYAAMIDRLAAGYLRPLRLRRGALRRAL